MHLRQETIYKAPWDRQGIEQSVWAREITRESAREFAKVNKSKNAREGKANKLEMLIWVWQL
jgi:hypothetical protein